MLTETTQKLVAYHLGKIQEDVIKMDNDPTDIDKWVIIQRLFLVMISIYNMGKKKQIDL